MLQLSTQSLVNEKVNTPWKFLCFLLICEECIGLYFQKCSGIFAQILSKSDMTFELP